MNQIQTDMRSEESASESESASEGDSGDDGKKKKKKHWKNRKNKHKRKRKGKKNKKKKENPPGSTTPPNMSPNADTLPPSHQSLNSKDSGKKKYQMVDEFVDAYTNKDQLSKDQKQIEQVQKLSEASVKTFKED